MRDQLQVIDQSLKNYGASAAEQALAYCVKHRLYRATDFADAAQHFSHQEQQEADESTLNVESLVQVDKEKYTAKPQIREFQTYERILGGG